MLSGGAQQRQPVWVCRQCTAVRCRACLHTPLWLQPALQSLNTVLDSTRNRRRAGLPQDMWQVCMWASLRSRCPHALLVAVPLAWGCWCTCMHMGERLNFGPHPARSSAASCVSGFCLLCVGQGLAPLLWQLLACTFCSPWGTWRQQQEGWRCMMCVSCVPPQKGARFCVCCLCGCRHTHKAVVWVCCCVALRRCENCGPAPQPRLLLGVRGGPLPPPWAFLPC